MCITPCRMPPPPSSPGRCCQPENRPAGRDHAPRHRHDVCSDGMRATVRPFSTPLNCSDAVTAVSEFLKGESQRLLAFKGPVDVIHNFFATASAHSAAGKRCAGNWGSGQMEVLLFHSSNLRSAETRGPRARGGVPPGRPPLPFKLLYWPAAASPHSWNRCASSVWKSG